MKGLTERAIISLAICAAVAAFFIAMAYAETHQTDSVPVNQVIDCWVGDQVQTPDVHFTVDYPIKGRYCLVVPTEGYNI